MIDYNEAKTFKINLQCEFPTVFGCLRHRVDKKRLADDCLLLFLF